MKRAAQVLSALCVLALVVSLCGCGGSDLSGGPSVGTAAKGGGGGKPPPSPPTPGRIAYQGNQVLTANADGSDATRLTTSGNNYTPSWSADGRICFVSDRDGEHRIYVMNADGSGQTPVTSPGVVEDMWPDWCPGAVAKPIVFARADPAMVSQGRYLYVTDVSGNEEQLTFGQDPPGSGREDRYRDGYPSWSPDGRFVVFNRWSATVYPYPEIDGLQVLRVSDGATWQLIPGEFAGYYASWSPDGTRIAYTGAGSVVYYVTVNTDGEKTGGPYQVNATAQPFITHPTWSPDGSYITFSAELGKHYTDTIFTVEVPEPNQPPNPTVTKIATGKYPDWSADVF